MERHSTLADHEMLKNNMEAIKSICFKNSGDPNFHSIENIVSNIEQLFVEPISKGVSISVDLEKMNPIVYISPNAESWLFELVENLLEKYSFLKMAKKIKQSNLYDEPLY